MKWIFILLVLVSCATQTPTPTKPVDVPPVVTTPVEEPKDTLPVDDYNNPPTPVDTAVGKFTVNIKTLNYNASQQAKVNEAAKYLRLIFNSEEYKLEVTNFVYNGKKQFVDNGGMSNEQVYTHLMGGAEALNPVLNYQMDITLKMYYSNNSTVGYTYKSDPVIYTNSKFHNKYSACGVASNSTHEWTHKMGFTHSSKWNAARDYSVPYAHNSIIEKLCPLAMEGKLTPLKPAILPLVPVPLN